MAMVGSDVEQLRQLSAAMKQAGSVLERIDQRISPAMRAGSWSGQDADMFHQSWVRTLRPRLLAASQSLRAAAADLEHQAAEQERASSGDGGSPGPAASALAALSGGWVQVPATAGGVAGFASAAEARVALDRILAEPASPQRAARIHEWAQRLGPNQRAFAEANALAVGNTDGMPLPMRDLANRNLADEYVKGLRDKGTLTEEEKARRAMLEELLYPRSAAWRDAHLLVFDPAGDGRIAVSLGSVDAAQNVAVLVPGISNSMSNFNRMLDDAARLRNGSPGTAVVAWLGYDAPPGPDDRSRVADMPAIVGESRAKEGAGALRAFVNDGLPLQGSDRVTVIGHSYGSIVVMRAAQDGGLSSVDNIVVMGSPGSEAYNSLDDLNLAQSQRFYSLSADFDLVAGGLVGYEDVGRLLPGVTPGVGQTPIDMVHGYRRPQDYGFGGTRLETDQWGSASRDAREHSDYYGQGTGSLLNLQALITGGVIEERNIQLEDLGSAIRGAVGEVPEFVGDRLEDATVLIGEGVTLAGDAFDSAKDAVGDGIDWARDAVGDGIDAAKEGVGDAIDATGDAFDSAKDAVGDGIDAAKDAAGAAMDGVTHLFRGR